MSNPKLKVRKARKDSRYSHEEMQVISKYKQEYREQTTRELRANVFKGKILVDLFNLWLKQGKAPNTEEDSATQMKELAAWVRNNWRPLSTTLETKAHVKVTAINMIWELEKEAVEAELQNILQVDRLEPNHPGLFQQRNAAAKCVIDKMSERDRAKLNSIVEERRTQGHPDHIRRERAERYRGRILRTWSQERWLDMAMATITFTVHTDCQGRLIADVHDDVLANVGLTGKPFTVKHKDRVIEMTRTFLDYMKSLRLQAPEAINPVQNNHLGAEPHTEPEPEPEPDRKAMLDITLTPEGYPILPTPIMKTELSKAVCERLMRAYLTHHYYLATAKKHTWVPFSSLKKDTAAFVAVSSVPDGLIITDPRNMHRDQIQILLRHWCQRQEELGPESAFRFRLILGPRKTRLSTEYLDIGAPMAQTKEKGKEREVPQLDGLLPISQTGTPTPSDSPIRGPIAMSTILGARPSPEINDMEDAVATKPMQSSGNIESTLQIGQQGIHEQQVGNVADELVRIDMGQMMRLKNMGHKVMGPINGPNEGLPQYEVPRLWLRELETEPVTISKSASGPTIRRPYPRPRPIPKKPALQDKGPIIDPALTNNAQRFATDTTEQQQEDVGSDLTATILLQSGLGSGPQLSTNMEGSSVLGKRSTIVGSPPHKTQA